MIFGHDGFQGVARLQKSNIKIDSFRSAKNDCAKLVNEGPGLRDVTIRKPANFSRARVWRKNYCWRKVFFRRKTQKSDDPKGRDKPPNGYPFLTTRKSQHGVENDALQADSNIDLRKKRFRRRQCFGTFNLTAW